jgi:dynein heavy chain
MNVLLKAMISSLEDLKKGLNGQLNMSEAMEDLASALSIDQVIILLS